MIEDLQDPQKALDFINELAIDKRGSRLNANQGNFFLGAWQGKSSARIHTDYSFSCSYDTVERTISHQVWSIIKEILGEKVNKSNLHGAVNAAWKKKQSSLSNPRQDGNGGGTLLPTLIPVVENPESSQLPLEERELPEGLVPLNSHFYIEHHVESSCYEAVKHPGALIRIKAPQKMGKTSLLERICVQAEMQGYETVNLTFEIDRIVFSNLYKFTQYFCVCVGKLLGMDDQLDQYWDDTYGCTKNVTTYFEEYLLAKRNTPLVLALDNVDLVFEQPEIANEFCGLLRFWHNTLVNRSDARGAIWKKLRLIVVHSTDVYGSLDIINSPLNGVGKVVPLKEFSREQVIKLAQRYEFNFAETEIEQLMNLVGGHPYLLRLALAYLKSHSVSLERLSQIASTGASPFCTYLRDILEKLRQHQGMETAFQRVIRTSEPVTLKSIEAFKLESMGLVKMQGDDYWIVSYNLFAQYFRSQFKDF